MKVCTKCHIEQDESEFHRNGTVGDGFKCVCKGCMKIIRAKWRRKRGIPERKRIHTVNGKICRGCNIEKQRNEFDKNKSRKGGLNSLCKSCRSKHNKATRTPEKTMLILNYTQLMNLADEDFKHKFKERVKRTRRNKRKNLSIGYIKSLLYQQGLSYGLINSYPELINIHRTMLKIKRKIKQHGNTTNKKKKNLFKRNWI